MDREMGADGLKISVIMPCYNAARYLDTSLKSVLAQTLKDFELIAVDNGSTDWTYEILERYKKDDRRLRIVRLTKNQGPSGGRNAGLKVASGEYIAFMDSDDKLPRDAYEIMYATAKNGRYDVVTGSYLEIEAGSPNVYHDVSEKNHSDTWEVLESGTVWNKLFKRRFLEENQISFEAYSYGEDGIFLGRVLSCCPSIIRTGKIVYHYLRLKNPNQLTESSCVQGVREYVATRKILYDLPLKFQDEEEFFLHNYQVVCFFKKYFSGLESFEEREEAFEYLRDFVGMFSWNEREETFQELFSVSYATFMQISYGDYLLCCIQNKKSVSQPQSAFDSVSGPRKYVLDEYRNGRIGFRYLLRYIKCWFYFKFHSHGRI